MTSKIPSMSAGQNSSSHDAWLEQIKELHKQDKIRRQGDWRLVEIHGASEQFEGKVDS